jgi:hypothetical protein
VSLTKTPVGRRHFAGALMVRGSCGVNRGAASPVALAARTIGIAGSPL